MAKAYESVLSSKFKSGDSILFTVLNWGLGHASRSIPLISYLNKMGCNVYLASDGEALELLKREFPEITSFTLPSYDIHYAHRSMVLNMFRQSPKILSRISKEKAETKAIVKKHSIKFIISDNRYGSISPNCQNYFICHQIGIQTNSKAINKALRLVHTRFINKFDECWIPDDHQHSLAGNISHPKGLKKYKFLGALSRLKESNEKKDIDVLVILSGPEPQREIFENKLLELLESSTLNIEFIRGTEKKGSKRNTNRHINVHDLCSSKMIEDKMNRTKLVICRSGYSSIMDLVSMNQKAILIPTPGQTEQIYLAKHLHSHPLFQTIQQKNLKESLNYLGIF